MDWPYLLILSTSLIFLGNALNNNKLIIINASGIYHQKKLVTDWSNFRNACIRQLPNQRTNSTDVVTDKYQIAVFYFDRSQDKNFMYGITLPGTQNKSEYEIIDAISYFSGLQLTYDIYD